MSLIEAMTMAAGLVYLVLLAWQARSGWPWRLALGLLFLLWLVRRDFASGLSYHFIGMTVVTLLLLDFGQKKRMVSTATSGFTA